VSLDLLVDLRRQFNIERFHHCKRRLQGWIAVFAEGAVKLLAGEAGLPGNLRHALGTGNDAQRLGDKRRIAGFKRIRHEEGDFLVIDQGDGGVIGGEFFGHVSGSIPCVGLAREDL
jgi:hypothetical protein